jgi:putative transposase
MSIPRRHGQVRGSYFVTSRTWESYKLFIVDAICEVFVRTLVKHRDVGEFALHGFVAMPDHIHVLLTPAQGKTLERCVQLIKGGSAHAIRDERAMNFPVWQRGFSDHRIRDAEDFASRIRYIELNPVKARLVSNPREYRWSSAFGSVTVDDVPQGLKPLVRSVSVGTAKAVP